MPVDTHGSVKICQSTFFLEPVCICSKQTAIWQEASAYQLSKLCVMSMPPYESLQSYNIFSNHANHKFAKASLLDTQSINTLDIESDAQVFSLGT